jgi:hypothetical protein
MVVSGTVSTGFSGGGCTDFGLDLGLEVDLGGTETDTGSAVLIALLERDFLTMVVMKLSVDKVRLDGDLWMV